MLLTILGIQEIKIDRSYLESSYHAPLQYKDLGVPPWIPDVYWAMDWVSSLESMNTDLAVRTPSIDGDQMLAFALCEQCFATHGRGNVKRLPSWKKYLMRTWHAYSEA